MNIRGQNSQNKLEILEWIKITITLGPTLPGVCHECKRMCDFCFGFFFFVIFKMSGVAGNSRSCYVLRVVMWSNWVSHETVSSSKAGCRHSEHVCAAHSGGLPRVRTESPAL